MPPGRWVHDRYRNENGWWSALVQERDEGPRADRVIRLLNTVVADQEKGGDLIEFMVRARAVLTALVVEPAPQWARTPPSVPGWYWWRLSPDRSPSVVEVDYFGDRLCERTESGGALPLGRHGGEWYATPLEVPQ